MAFFDNLVAKASETGQAAQEKAKNFTEAAKTRSENETLGKNLDGIFRDIGEAVYWLRPETLPGEITKEFEEIDKIEKQIAENKAKLQELDGRETAAKAKEVCPKCGKEVSSGSLFCGSCGAKLG